jgi:gamma-glutamyltranspeptidase/glutathione hydrolase/leukotriene-C4 hydrolase
MGLAILHKHNGTAVDAAITTTLCIGLLNAFSSGIGGGGFALVSVPPHLPEFGGPAVTAIDFRETSPAASHEEMYSKAGRGASQVGGLAVGVPGELRGLEEAHRLYGKLPWGELVEPVAELARSGWQVSRELARRLRIFGGFMLRDPTWAAVYAPRGELLVEGDWIRRPTYAKTLATIAKEGPGALYSGAIADDIVAAAQADGGILTHADLAGYRAHTYPAISGQFRGQTVYTADAPASGGVMLGMLQIMDPLLAPLTGAECYGEEQSHQLIEAMKFAFGARSEVCDPRFARNLTRLAEFRTPAWADAQRAKITNTTHEPGYYGLETEPITDSGTTHLSVVDQWGGAASVTSTVNLIWGSHVMAPNTGIILNDEQDDFAVPGAPDAFGLPPSPHNYPAPGKRPLSSTAPTIVHAPDGRVVGVLGGSGGSRIFPAVAMVLLNLACGDDISQAIERPRMHDQVLPPITTLEVGPEGVDTDWLAALKKRGHKIGQFDINVGASEVQAVVVDKRGVWAASDSRKNGVAAGY